MKLTTAPMSIIGWRRFDGFSTPHIVEKIYSLRFDMFGDNNDFSDIKRHYNDLMLSLWPYMQRQVEIADDKLKMAIQFAMAGNYEGLSGCGLNIFYLFLCKCDLFVRRFDVPRFTGIMTRELNEHTDELLLTPSPTEERMESPDLTLEADSIFKAKEITFDGEAELESRIEEAMKAYDAAMDEAAGSI